MEVVYDIETYPNCFTLAAEHVDYPITWAFEISDYRNDSKEIIEFVRSCTRMIGFNNVGFDYPVLHTLMQMGKGNAQILYDKAMAIIGLQDENRWSHLVYPSDRHCEQVDLFLIHHFDNKARATSLKVIEFNMRLASVEDLPFPVGTTLNQEQIKVLKKYNAHDVTATKAFYYESLDMIRFREELTAKYQRDFLNHNDTKIGKDYLTMQLEANGVQCYTYGREGRHPMQTLRPVIALRDAILPWIEFQQPEFNRVLNWLKQQTITETKGVFKDLTATVNGFEFVFGLGGIHGSIENEIVESDEGSVIIDLDVTSYYPSLAIVNRWYPEHLTEKFCDIYADLKEQRVNYKKGTAENAMLKLGLNGVFGDSNNQFSIFYDRLLTMKITLNGQLLLCLLAENLMRIPGLRLIQTNTDGVTIHVKREYLIHVKTICDWWEGVTNLQLEQAEYSKMAIADVNSYLAVYAKGGVKRKGRYEYDLDWNQNHSALIVPKIAEERLTGVPSTGNLMDFMLRIKVPRNSRLVDSDGVIYQNTTRYYVAIGGVELFKMMPPLPGKGPEWRKFAVEKGRTVCVCNDIRDAVLPIDLSYYENEVDKLTLGLR